MTRIPYRQSAQEFTPAPEGLHIAVCRYEGKKLSRSEKWGTKVKIRLVFQLEEVNPETKRRFQVQVFFGQSMFKGKSGMSNLRKYVESWRGRAFSEQDEIHWLT